MAISAAYENSASISGTEYSLPNNTTYAGGSAITVDGVYQVLIDFSALQSTETYEFKMYEKVQSAGTQRVFEYACYVGVQQQPHLITPPFILMHGWDVTLKKLAGTDRTIAWCIRKIV